MPDVYGETPANVGRLHRLPESHTRARPKGYAWVLALPARTNRKHFITTPAGARRRAREAVRLQGATPAVRLKFLGVASGWRYGVTRSGVALEVDVWPNGATWCLARPAR